MRFLILDDDHNRLATFRRQLIGHVVTCVETAAEAIEKLDQEDWDVVCLDHDLGNRIYVPSGPGTGYEVATWLGQHPEKNPTHVLIHSYNANGAQKMAEAIPNATLAPGVWAKIGSVFEAYRGD